MARSRRAPQRRSRVVTPPRIPHQRLGRGARAREQLPDPKTLGLQSSLEVRIFIVLKKHGIPFRAQVNFDGGALVYGGQRADFYLLDRPVIVEGLGPWHDLPGAALRDDRKWAARQQEGLSVVTIRHTEAITLEQCEMNLLARLGRPVTDEKME